MRIQTRSFWGLYSSWGLMIIYCKEGSVVAKLIKLQISRHKKQNIFLLSFNNHYIEINFTIKLYVNDRPVYILSLVIT
jgi:hypothetical protein